MYYAFVPKSYEMWTVKDSWNSNLFPLTPGGKRIRINTQTSSLSGFHGYADHGCADPGESNGPVRAVSALRRQQPTKRGPICA